MNNIPELLVLGYLFASLTILRDGTTMDNTDATSIVLEDLKRGYPGLDKDTGGSHRIAAIVCLDSQKHASDVNCEMKSLKETKTMLRLTWNEAVTQQMKNTWHDRREATEMGAAGVAILVILAFTEYTVLRRMDIDEKTGMDYWLSKSANVRDLTENFLKGDARLEVAGRRSASSGTIREVVRGKLKRSKKSDKTGTPAYVIVMEFSRPEIYFETRMADL